MKKERGAFAEVTFSAKFTNEYGFVCNEVIFTAKSGGRLCLTLFDVKPLNEDNLDESYYKAAESRL
ncbi:MAG: hypothetical protein K2O14_08895 [Oscillospiraceae bacterium]|nr:hypothetical protein [Oscillospiraceae bacterium]